ncbi:MAG TPA: peptidase M1, partial [Flavobacterium sp.]|nr:peptidase M1 [Flavobacterium sp.]
MKKKFLQTITFLLVCISFSSIQAQESKDPKSVKVNNYSYLDAFAPNFYTKNSTEFRSASGNPGPKYWQNSASYKLSASLIEESKTIDGFVEMNYTNNSPDALEFVWMYLEQNLFSKDSRGNAVIPVSGSRNGAKGEKFDGGHKVSNVMVDGKAVKYEIIDTRMKIFLNTALKPYGGKAKISMKFSFISPEYGSDRMGYLPTKNGTIFTIAQWYPRVAVYDDIRGWNTQPYLGAGEFYCEYGDFEISITVPSNHFVVCSGEITNAAQVMTSTELANWEKAKTSDATIMVRSSDELGKVTANGTKTWKFKMTNTRDVAWASSSAFIIDAAKINLPSGKKAMAISAYPIESEGQKAWSRSTEYTK